ncbi:MAG: adenylate kinase [Candidatus Omnitrophota bacterium]
MNLVLLGPPGAGKGTQAAILKERYGFLHVSTGDMLRECVREGGELGKEIQKCMNSGELVPDDIVTRAVLERVKRPDAAIGIMLDGYPRTRNQAETLDRSLKEVNKELDVVLYFSTSKEMSVSRLSGRRVCTKCGMNYHIKNIPPKKNGICDTCGIELIQREDDSPEIVKNRLTVYEERTKGLIDYYANVGLLREVNGDLQAGKLFEEIYTLFQEEGLIDDNS